MKPLTLLILALGLALAAQPAMAVKKHLVRGKSSRLSPNEQLRQAQLRIAKDINATAAPRTPIPTPANMPDRWSNFNTSKIPPEALLKTWQPYSYP